MGVDTEFEQCYAQALGERTLPQGAAAPMRRWRACAKAVKKHCGWQTAARTAAAA